VKSPGAAPQAVTVGPGKGLGPPRHWGEPAGALHPVRAPRVQLTWAAGPGLSKELEAGVGEEGL